MEAVALSILVVVIYFILIYIFGRTNKNTPKFTSGSFTSTVYTSEGSTKPYKNEPIEEPKEEPKEESKENIAEHYKHILEINATYAERVLYSFLTGKIDFEFQKIIYTDNKKHFFIADFYIPSKNLIIELDGEYHDNIKQQDKDIWRTRILKSLGYKVIRFKNKQITESNNLFWVLNIIKNK